MLVSVVAGQSMESLKERFKRRQDGHTLFHGEEILRVPQVSGTAHVKLTGLSVFMYFGQIGILKH